LLSSIVVFKGHAVTAEQKLLAIPANIIHIVSINIWLGSLPFLLFEFYKNKPTNLVILKKFSYMASLCMISIIITGIVLTVLNLNYSFAALLGTKYGYIILLKIFFLCFVLICAFFIRFYYLRKKIITNIKNILIMEVTLAFGVFLLGIFLSQTIPGAHDEIKWPLNFRVSTDVAFEQNKVVEKFTYINIIFFTFLGILLADFLVCRNNYRSIILLIFSFLIFVPLNISYLSVEAYPVTYKTPSVPYSAISVYNGKNIYLNNCVDCHGKSGHGDGILANQLENIPPANLTEPHTAYHTAGDIFWWLTYGKNPGAMPGFNDILSEDQRWDLINYIRTLSSGYEARIISNKTIKNKPWLSSIDFDYVTLKNNTGRLSKFRYKKNVLLVFFNINKINNKKILNLNNNFDEYNLANTKVILIPNYNNLKEDYVNKFKSFIHNKINFLTIYEGSNEITETYRLYRRTLEKPDKYDNNENINYMEILIDKFGYVRARAFVPYNENTNYNKKEYFLMLKELFAEKEILPPPDEHVH